MFVKKLVSILKIETLTHKKLQMITPTELVKVKGLSNRLTLTPCLSVEEFYLPRNVWRICIISNFNILVCFRYLDV